MDLVRLSKVAWETKEQAGVDVGHSPMLPKNSSADVVYARLQPGEALHRHFHRRPSSDGFVCCFFFRGASIEIVLSDETLIVNEDEPFHVTFFDQEVHGIRNLSVEKLLFEVICAPPFREGEEVYESAED
jgi:hypothetical protein